MQLAKLLLITIIIIIIIIIIIMFLRHWITCLHSTRCMTASLPLAPAAGDFEHPTLQCIRFQELAQVRVIDHSLLLDCISGTNYYYMILNLLSWSSAGCQRHTCFAEDHSSSAQWLLILEHLVNVNVITYLLSATVTTTTIIIIIKVKWVWALGLSTVTIKWRWV